MYIRGLIPRNSAELAEAVPIEGYYWKEQWFLLIASLFKIGT